MEFTPKLITNAIQGKYVSSLGGRMKEVTKITSPEDPRSKAQRQGAEKISGGYPTISSVGARKLSQAQRAGLKIENGLGNHTRIEPLGRQSEKPSSLDRRRLAGFGGVRDMSVKAAMDNSEYTEGQNPSINKDELKNKFKEKFLKSLENQYLLPSQDQEHELSAISYDTNPLDIRKEWREAFLITRGQIFDEMKIKGKIIEDGLLDNNPHKIILFREASTQINEVPNDSLSSTVTDMLKQYPNEEVIAYIPINQSLDSYYTCLSVHKKLGSPSEQKLQKNQYQQKLQELNDFLEELKISINQLKILHVISKSQYLQDNNKEKLIQAIEERIREQENSLLRINYEERIEFKRYESYYMLLGTPEVRSMVAKLPKTCTVDSLMLLAGNENISAPEVQALERDQPNNVSEHALEQKHYRARVILKHVNNDNISKEDTNQFMLLEQSFKQIFLQALEEQDSPHLLLPKYAEEFASINSDTRVFDLPTEWQKPFLIARGQAHERASKEGTLLSKNPYSRLLPENDSLTLHLENSEERYEILKNDLPSQLAAIFKQKPQERVSVSITTCKHEPDSLFTCKEIYKDLNLQTKQEFKNNLYKQKLQEWKETQFMQNVQTLQMIPILRELNKSQFLLMINHLQKPMKSIEQHVMYQEKLDEKLDKMKDMLKNINNEIIEKHKVEAEQKKQELSEAQKIRDAYNMVFGTPKALSIVGNLCKDYTIDSLTIEPLANSRATEPLNESLAANSQARSSGAWLEGDDYKISFSITYTGMATSNAIEK